MKMCKIPQDALEQVVNYLALRPYAEVQSIFKALEGNMYADSSDNEQGQRADTKEPAESGRAACAAKCSNRSRSESVKEHPAAPLDQRTPGNGSNTGFASPAQTIAPSASSQSRGTNVLATH